MTAPPLQWSIDTKAVSHGNPAAFAFEASGAERNALKLYAGIEDLASFQSEVRVTTAGRGGRRVCRCRSARSACSGAHTDWRTSVRTFLGGYRTLSAE